jgi:hypothetical protein
MSQDQLNQMKDQVLKVAVEMFQRGPGYSQEASVFREMRQRLNIGYDPGMEQNVLTCWHDLFLEKRLSWGYNFDNPNAPFFHVREPN